MSAPGTPPTDDGRARVDRDLWVLSAAFLFIFMGTGALQQFLVPYLEETTSWSAMRSSLVLATVYLSFVFWRLLAGYSIRALGDYWAIVVGAVMYTMFAAAVLAYPRLWALLVAAFAWAWGAALLWITSSAQVLDASRREHYGRAAGIFYAATHVGFVIGVSVLGLLQRAFGGLEMLIGAIAMTAVGTGICLFVPRRDFPRELPSFTCVLRVAFGRDGRIVGVIQFIAAIGYGLLLGVFASSIRAEYGMEFIAAITMSFYVVRALVSPFAGALSDRLGRARVLAGGFGMASAALLVPVAAPSAATLALAAAVLGALTATVLAAVLAFVGDSAASTSRQATVAGLYVWRDLGVGVSILFGQYLRSQFGGFQAAFAFFAVAFFACALLSARLGRPSGLPLARA